MVLQGKKYSFRTNLGIFRPIFGLFCGRKSHLITRQHNRKTQNPQLVSFDDNRETDDQ